MLLVLGPASLSLWIDWTNDGHSPKQFFLAKESRGLAYLVFEVSIKGTALSQRMNHVCWQSMVSCDDFRNGFIRLRLAFGYIQKALVVPFGYDIAMTTSPCSSVMNGRSLLLVRRDYGPSMLGQEKKSAYLTYGGAQNLSADATEEPGKCIFLRILFALFGTGPCWLKYVIAFQPSQRMDTS